MGRPIVLVSSRHRPHELAWLAYSALAGLTLTAAPAPPFAWATWFVYAWAGLLFMSGIAGLWGALIRHNVERALGYEMGAMLLNAAAMIAFAGGVVATFSVNRAWFATGAALIWAIANLWRAWQILTDLREIRQEDP